VKALIPGMARPTMSVVAIWLLDRVSGWASPFGLARRNARDRCYRINEA
jgi:hypothetical protein